ncbi:MAG TPA: MFS transporter [Spirochaetaceae bacterium]|nr:MFS transporter [Spirochaetaceae bacterium]
MAVLLSAKKLAWARRTFNIFNLFNSFSFVFVSGSIITLFALRMGASTSIIGLLNALVYITFFMLPLGKRMVRHTSIIKVFGWGWVIRYIALLPILFAPLFASRGQTELAILVLILGTAGFHISRGVAMIGNNPVLGLLSSGGGDKPRSDQGRYLVNVSVVNSVAAILANIVLAFLLGEQASLWTYAIAIGIGIISGLVGCIFLFKVPEPDAFSSNDSPSLWDATRQALLKPDFRAFIFTFMLLSFLSGMGRSFLPVYAKKVFTQGDDAIMVYSIVAALGSIAMGLITRLVVDRLGSKPLFIIYSAIGLISFLPIAIIPNSGAMMAAPAMIGFFLSVIHFLSSFGFAGEENAAQVYYFGLVPKEKMLDLAVIYNLAYGIGGALGSFLGGGILEVFDNLGIATQGAFRLYYAIISIILVVVIYGMRNLPHMGAKSVTQSLSVLFSPRELRAFDLLTKLDQSASAHEEVRLLQQLGKSESTLTQKELVEYLHSPRFEVRSEALLALESIPELDSETIGALIHEVKTNVYSTAYVAARILGKQHSQVAVEVLIDSLDEPDYMLQSTAMIALARLGAHQAIPKIEEVIRSTDNPRVRISGAYALELFGSIESIPTLISCLKAEDRPANVSDELVLSISGILGIDKEFYLLYSEFIDDNDSGVAQLIAHAHDLPLGKERIDAWTAAVHALFAPAPDTTPLARFLLSSSNISGSLLILSDALLDPKLDYPGFNYLCAYVALHIENLRDY